MERGDFLKLCQINSVQPNSVEVRYKDIICYPLALKIWFNNSGETQNTAILLEKKSRCVIECGIKDVECLDKVK